MTDAQCVALIATIRWSTRAIQAQIVEVAPGVWQAEDSGNVEDHLERASEILKAAQELPESA